MGNSPDYIRGIGGLARQSSHPGGSDFCSCAVFQTWENSSFPVYMRNFYIFLTLMEKLLLLMIKRGLRSDRSSFTTKWS